VQSVAIAVIVTIATLGGFSATATAQDASPSPAAVPRDLYLDMPYTLGGFDPEIVMTRGAEHYAGLQSGDPQDDQTRADLASMLETVGAQIEDMESGYALVSQEDFFSFVVAIRVHGAERGTLLPAYQPILSAGLHEPTIDTRVMGDKEVMVITTSGEADENVDLYVYDAGDTLWMVQGPDDVVEVALADLP
jgi:hypothetical protein